METLRVWTYPLVASAWCICRAQAQYTTLIDDNFADRSKFIDKTLTVPTWVPYSAPTSGFILTTKADNSGLTYNTIKVSDSANTHKRYTINNGLKESTCINYDLGSVSREDISMVEFDILWG